MNRQNIIRFAAYAGKPDQVCNPRKYEIIKTDETLRRLECLPAPEKQGVLGYYAYSISIFESGGLYLIHDRLFICRKPENPFYIWLIEIMEDL